MNIETAITELLPYKDKDILVKSFIDKLENLSKTPEHLLLTQIELLIKQMMVLKSKQDIWVQTRSLAEAGCRVICILTILKPVDPARDFGLSNTESPCYRARQFLQISDQRRQKASSSLFFGHDITPMNYDDLVKDDWALVRPSSKQI